MGATCFALTTLTALAIVSTIREVDSLSVIALALATLAFVVQIILYVVQSNIATQQAIRSEEIYGATLKALASIEEKTEGTRQAVTGSSAKMIEALIGKSIPEAASAGVRLDSAEFSEQLAERIDTYMANVSNEQGVVVPHSRESRRRPSPIRPEVQPQRNPLAPLEDIGNSRRQHAKVLDSFPNDLALVRDAVAVLKNLTDDELDDTWRLWNDERRYGPTRMDQTSGGLQSLSTARKLTECGIARRVRVNWDSTSSVFILTDSGRIAGRVLSGNPVPDSPPDGVTELRARLAKVQHETAERIAEYRRQENSQLPIGEL